MGQSSYGDETFLFQEKLLQSWNSVLDLFYSLLVPSLMMTTVVKGDRIILRYYGYASSIPTVRAKYTISPFRVN